MKNKLLFLIGIRRSGTSICRHLLMSHPQITHIEFEPHDLMFVTSTQHLNRYKNSQYHIDTVNRFKNKINKYYGAKIVINSQLGGIRWKWLHKYFPEAKFVFICRNIQDTYKSYAKTDAKVLAGISPYYIYKYWYNQIIESFKTFHKEYSEKSCIIHYEHLVNDADNTLIPVWKLLQLNPIQNLKEKMHKPLHWSVDKVK